MSQSLYIGKEPNFQKIIIASVIIHVFFITLVAIPLKSKKREYKSYFVNIVSPLELRRAAKLASKSKVTSSTKAPIKKKAAPRRRVKADSGVTLESANRVTKEIERLRALSALTKKKKDKDKETAAKLKLKEIETASAIENIRQKIQGSISIGSGILGATSSADANPYAALVKQQIENEWIHPYFGSEELEVIASFKVDIQGNIISPKIIKSSVNSLYDRSVMKAMLKATLPPPAVEMQFELRFTYP